jgi:hypothetical protein
MTEKNVCPDSILESMNLSNNDDKIISSKNLTIIFNLSNDIAKQIKEQVINTIEHFVDLTP